MKDPVTPLVAAAMAIAAASFWPAPGLAERPVVVELFTSQGCNSCPPADALLGELTTRQDVLPLSFHVTYWDRLGWPDTFGLSASTERQRTYARDLGLRGMYTPQMVVGGRIDVVGSRRQRVFEAIDLMARHGEPDVPITIDGSLLKLGAGSQGSSTIWLVAVDRGHDVAIGRGENRGRTIRYHNVVRELTELGRWSGDPVELALPLERLAAEGRDGAAVLVQELGRGDILAAAYIDLGPR